MRLATSLLLSALLPVAQAQIPANPYSYSRTGASSYYGAADGIKRGKLKTVTIEPDNPQLCSVATYDYDAYGNAISSTTTNCAGASGRALFPSGTGAGSGTYAAYTLPSGTLGSGIPAVSVPAGVFPTTITNAAGFTENRTYDPRFGAVLTLIGPNQLGTSWRYDDFGRPTKRLHADNTSIVAAYCLLSGDTTSNSNTANGDPLSCPTPPSGEAPPDAVMFMHAVPLNTAGNAMGSYTRVYSDRLGRAIRSVTLSFDGGSQPSGRSGVPVYVDAVYNNYGVKEFQTQPYFATSKSSTVAGANDVGVTRTVVDALGRPVTVYVADPNGQGGVQSMGAYGSRTVAVTSFSYSAGSVITTNDKGQTRTEESNVLGELVRVKDTTGATLIHQRDAFSNLVKTRDALGNTTTVVYDIAGRKTQLQDPDAGTWNYDYDALGQLVWQQSPKQSAASTQTTMVYDVLGRMTSRTEPEYVSTWRYDKNADGSSCMNGNASLGKGKLCQTSTSNGLSRQYAYDALGRPSTSLSRLSASLAFSTQATYEPATGRLSTLTYPSGLQVSYAYTGLGRQEKLQLLTATTVNPRPNAQGVTAASASLPAGYVFWQAQSVGAWGAAEQLFYGNGITSRAAYEASTGRVTDLTAGQLVNGAMPAPASRVVSQHYTWDSLSNLRTRSDDVGDGTNGAVSETFTYDDGLNRLTNYTVSGLAVPGQSRSVTLQYNALGMLLHKSDVGNYSYNAQGGAAGSKPHALQSITGAGANSFQYDANGNVTVATAGKYRSVSYTSFNLPDSGNGLQGPSGSPKYTWLYDENHARLSETRVVGTTGRTTYYLHPDNAGGLAFELELSSGAPSLRHYLNAGGQTVAVLVSSGPPPNGTQFLNPANYSTNKLEYWHKDHLGSLASTTDHTGAVTARYAYDPFGKRRFTNGSYDAAGSVQADWNPNLNAGTDRGYTGHEHLDDVGVVHMNGRLFDPTAGVFMQPDPLVQDAGDLQNFNRYGYCLNNPLTCTDPTGFASVGPGAAAAGSGSGSAASMFGSMAVSPSASPTRYAMGSASDATGKGAAQATQGGSGQAVSGFQVPSFSDPYTAMKWVSENSAAIKAAGWDVGSMYRAFQGWAYNIARDGQRSAENQRLMREASDAIAAQAAIAGAAAGGSGFGSSVRERKGDIFVNGVFVSRTYWVNAESVRQAIDATNGGGRSLAFVPPAPVIFAAPAAAKTSLLEATATGVLRIAGPLALALTPSSTSDESVVLYRAVSAAELADIKRTKTFNPAPNGSEMKQFWRTPGDAQSFSEIMNNMLKSVEYTNIVSVRVSWETYTLGVPGTDPLNGVNRPYVTYSMPTLPPLNLDAVKNGVQVVK